MSAGATPAACVPRPVRTPQAPMSARVPLAFAYPAMARTVKVRVLMGVRNLVYGFVQTGCMFRSICTSKITCVWIIVFVFGPGLHMREHCS